MTGEVDRLRPWITIYLKGFCMGAADIVPGVSGGTIALVVGIYDRLIAALASIDPRVLGRLRFVHDPTARAELREELAAMDLRFLLVLGLGIASAVLVVSRIITIALEANTVVVYAFFFGLIAASAVVLYRTVTVGTPGRLVVAVAGVAAAWTIAGVGAGHGDGGLFITFLAGAVAIAAMILPGVSGAVFLLILGQYDVLLAALTDTVDAILGVLGGGQPGAIVRPGLVVGTFLLGAGVGLLTTARLVRWSLDHHRELTLLFLVSLMVGSLRLPGGVIIRESPGWSVAHATVVGAGMALGAAGILLLDRYTGSLHYTENR